MKDIINQLNKAFDHRTRLGIMSLLMVNPELDFNALKEQLELTDGNLATHITALEKQEYISVTKQFVGKKTQTLYRATDLGRTAFQEHLALLEKLLNYK